MTSYDIDLTTPSEPFWTAVWRAPFRADTWRRTLYALIALPVTIATLVLVVIGRSGLAVRTQRKLTGTLLDDRHPRPGAPGPGRIILGALANVPVAAVALVVTGYFWLVVFLNVFFPVRALAGTLDLDQSWGGPSLLGAWAVHAAGGVAFAFVTPWVVRGLTWLHARLAG